MDYAGGKLPTTHPVEFGPLYNKEYKKHEFREQERENAWVSTTSRLPDRFVSAFYFQSPWIKYRNIAGTRDQNLGVPLPGGVS